MHTKMTHQHAFGSSGMLYGARPDAVVTDAIKKIDSKILTSLLLLVLAAMKKARPPNIDTNAIHATTTGKTSTLVNDVD